MIPLFYALACLISAGITLLAFRWIFGSLLGITDHPMRRAAGVAALGAGMAAAVFYLSCPWDLPLTPDRLLGSWVVYNDAEQSLMALWRFGRDEQGQIVVTGEIYKVPDPGRVDDRSRWIHDDSFGPHPVKLDQRRGTLSFYYTSQKHGSGQAKLQRIRAFRGRYEDGPSTPEEQRDAGPLALYPEDGRPVDPLLPRLIQALLVTGLGVGLALLATVGLVAWWRSGGPLSGSRHPLLLSSALFLGLFFVIASTASTTLPEREVLPREGLPGAWNMEYLADRTRLGKIEIVAGSPPSLRLTGRLIFRQGFEPAAGPGRGTLSGETLSYNIEQGRLSFSYQTTPGVGSGEATFEPTLALTGPFRDRTTGTEGATYGDFLLLPVAEDR